MTEILYMSVCVAIPLNTNCYAANTMPIVTQPMTFAPVPPRKRKINTVNSENVVRNVAQRPFTLEPVLPAAPVIPQTLTPALEVPASVSVGSLGRLADPARARTGAARRCAAHFLN